MSDGVSQYLIVRSSPQPDIANVFRMNTSFAEGSDQRAREILVHQEARHLGHGADLLLAEGTGGIGESRQDVVSL